MCDEFSEGGDSPLNLKTKSETNLYIKLKIIYSGGITSFHLKLNINYNVLFYIIFG